jgi:8-oxo-dGTP diphosphatase
LKKIDDRAFGGGYLGSNPSLPAKLFRKRYRRERNLVYLTKLINCIKTMTKYITTYTDILPKSELVSAVFLIALKGSKILAIENESGWDIPGGHVEEGETPEEALIREVREEAGACFSNAKLFAVIESDEKVNYKNKVMLLFTTSDFKLGQFVPNEETFNRELLEIEEFTKRYTYYSNILEHISYAKSLI